MMYAGVVVAAVGSGVRPLQSFNPTPASMPAQAARHQALSSPIVLSRQVMGAYPGTAVPRRQVIFASGSATAAALPNTLPGQQFCKSSSTKALPQAQLQDHAGPLQAPNMPSAGSMHLPVNTSAPPLQSRLPSALVPAAGSLTMPPLLRPSSTTVPPAVPGRLSAMGQPFATFSSPSSPIFPARTVQARPAAAPLPAVAAASAAALTPTPTVRTGVGSGPSVHTTALLPQATDSVQQRWRAASGAGVACSAPQTSSPQMLLLPKTALGAAQLGLLQQEAAGQVPEPQVKEEQLLGTPIKESLALGDTTLELSPTATLDLTASERTLPPGYLHSQGATPAASPVKAQHHPASCRLPLRDREGARIPEGVASWSFTSGLAVHNAGETLSQAELLQLVQSLQQENSTLHRRVAALSRELEEARRAHPA